MLLFEKAPVIKLLNLLVAVDVNVKVPPVPLPSVANVPAAVPLP
jgi:hypothetical protein